MLSELILNPVSTLVYLLLALPGRMIAISCHEWGHAYMACRCGDDTARRMGRLTLNPLAHLDLFGFAMMMIVGFGWAKPVPVDPRNFRNFRRDDLKVSLAGITMNLILFVIGVVLMYGIAAMALYKASLNTYTDAFYIESYMGMKVFISGDMGMWISDVVQNVPYLSEYLIQPAFGTVTRYLYEMLMYFTLTNLVLAVFNLIPVPPLDGWHVLDDLGLYRIKGRIPVNFRQWASVIMMVLLFSGASTWLINGARDLVFSGVGYVAGIVYQAMGLI